MLILSKEERDRILASSGFNAYCHAVVKSLIDFTELKEVKYLIDDFDSYSIMTLEGKAFSVSYNFNKISDFIILLIKFLNLFISIDNSSFSLNVCDVEEDEFVLLLSHIDRAFLISERALKFDGIVYPEWEAREDSLGELLF